MTAIGGALYFMFLAPPPPPPDNPCSDANGNIPANKFVATAVSIRFSH